MNKKIDELVEVANGLENAVNDASEHWCDPTETALRFRPESDTLDAFKAR